MQLELIFSESKLDVNKESSDYRGSKSIVRSHLTDDDSVYIDFFADNPARNIPHVRIAFCLEDAIKIVEALTEKGNSEATIVNSACKFAFSITEFAKNSN